MQIIHAPNPALRIQTKPVKKIKPRLYQTLKDMIKLTKTFKEPEGVGLAATQIGLEERFFVARLLTAKKIPPSEPAKRKSRWAGYDKEFVAIINPKILSSSKGTKSYFEGCLSIPTIWGQVRRHTSINVDYQDIKGNVIKKTLTGIPAWIFQHEVDHLDGILFTERVLQQKGKFYKFKGKDKTGTDIFEEVTL
ncbi:MAG: peptide deformylase [Microgenomates group bacterium Gr01-1014_7]|nr:MAG: peptide deformylase [Microgenomates group bacterium Gr01-1014_7]